MTKVEITDEISVNSWLRRQPYQTQIWFGTRCALRMMPGLGEEPNETFDFLALMSFRAILIPAAAATCQAFEIEVLKPAAKAAHFDMSRSVAHPAKNAALFASAAVSVVADSSTYYTRAAYSAIFNPEAASADANSPGLWSPLWPNKKIPKTQLDLWTRMKATMQASPEKWAFWLRWYEAILDGNPLPWELCLQIAKDVTDEQWDAGPEVVATIIKEIERAFYTSVGPPIVLKDNGKWGFERDVKIPPEPLGYAIDTVQISLNAALTSGTANGLSETSGETIMIQSACNHNRNHPSIVATLFWNACMSLNRNIGEVYPEDASLIALKNQLYVSVEELCEQDELVRDRVAKLAALETRRYPTQTEREEIAKLPEELRDNLTDEAHDAIAEATDIILSTDKPPRLWRARLVNWVTTLGRGIEQGQKAEKKATWLLKLGRRIAEWFFDGDAPGGE